MAKYWNNLVGSDGSNGDDGKSVLNGSSDPTSNDGAEGDFWINTNANTIWGPKTATGWPSTGTEMIGANGTNGTNGDDGKSVLNGSSDPTSMMALKEIFGLTPMQIPFGDLKQPLVGQVLEQK